MNRSDALVVFSGGHLGMTLETFEAQIKDCFGQRNILVKYMR